MLIFRMAAPSSPLRVLADTIPQAVTVIDDAYAAAGRSYPPLRVPFNADSPAEALFRQEEVAKAVDTILSASSALVASAGTPHLRVVRTTMGVRPLHRVIRVWSRLTWT